MNAWSQNGDGTFNLGDAMGANGTVHQTANVTVTVTHSIRYVVLAMVVGVGVRKVLEVFAPVDLLDDEVAVVALAGGDVVLDTMASGVHVGRTVLVVGGAGIFHQNGVAR